MTGLSGSAFEDGQGPDEFIAHGGGSVLKRFDVLQPTGNSIGQMTYGSGQPAASATASFAPAGAVISQERLNALGKKVRVMLSGFSYHTISDNEPPTYPPARVEHVKRILDWIDGLGGTPVGIDPITLATNRLAQNYPNPFNPSTAIRYSIRSPGHVTLRVYDVRGRLVATLVDKEQAPRAEGYKIDWRGRSNTGGNVTSGVYFYRLVAGEFIETRKMVLLR